MTCQGPTRRPVWERVGEGTSNRLKSERLLGLYYIGPCGLFLRKGKLFGNEF